MRRRLPQVGCSKSGRARIRGDRPESSHTHTFSTVKKAPPLARVTRSASSSDHAIAATLLNLDGLAM
eukprot:4767905-Prymnesium_polylepis.3